jgi:hypothetical protein
MKGLALPGERKPNKQGKVRVIFRRKTLQVEEERKKC